MPVMPVMPVAPVRAGTTPAAGAMRNAPQSAPPGASSAAALEVGGRKGPEPTRYGDWEKNGRCTDF